MYNEGVNNMGAGLLSYSSRPNVDKNNEHTEAFQEAIYDFGGANVKSCASIALNKSISKGLIPPGTTLQMIPSNNSQTVIMPPSAVPYKAPNSTECFRGYYFSLIGQYKKTLNFQIPYLNHLESQ